MSQPARRREFVHFRRQRNCPDVQREDDDAPSASRLCQLSVAIISFCPHTRFFLLVAQADRTGASALRTAGPIPTHPSNQLAVGGDYRWMRRLHASVKRYTSSSATKEESKSTADHEAVSQAY